MSFACFLSCRSTCVGDAIYINASSGAVTKLVGPCDLYATEFDLQVCPVGLFHVPFARTELRAYWNKQVTRQ